MYIDNNIEDVGKYKKKKDSSKSKSSKKADHKHEYTEVLLRDVGDIQHIRYRRAEVCKICGKIGHIHFFETKPHASGGRVVIQDGELIEMYKNLPRLTCTGDWPEYVDDISRIKELLL